jgi:hypothetical protein
MVLNDIIFGESWNKFTGKAKRESISENYAVESKRN